jgi:hypothetical protein
MRMQSEKGRKLIKNAILIRTYNMFFSNKTQVKKWFIINKNHFLKIEQNKILN